MSPMMAGTLDLPLFIHCTIDILSTNIVTFWFWRTLPNVHTNRTTTNISFQAICFLVFHKYLSVNSTKCYHTHIGQLCRVREMWWFMTSEIQDGVLERLEWRLCQSAGLLTNWGMVSKYVFGLKTDSWIDRL